MIPTFSRSWLRKITQQFDLEIAAVSLRRACDIRRAWRPTWESPISPSISDPDLLAKLVEEDHAAVRLGDRRGQLAQGLRHQAGLEADVGVAHLALDL